MPDENPRRRWPYLVLGVLIGVGLIGPSSGLASKFLTSGKANKTFVRYMDFDRNATGTIFSGAPPQFLNATVKVPTAGVLVIQGSARFFNEDDQGNDEATITYQVNQADPVVAASETLGPNENPSQRDPGETAQLAYVDIVRVGQGSHVVRQLMGASQGETPPSGSTGSGLRMSFSNAALVVTFFPARGASLI